MSTPGEKTIESWLGSMGVTEKLRISYLPGQDQHTFVEGWIPTQAVDEHQPSASQSNGEQRVLLVPDRKNLGFEDFEPFVPPFLRGGNTVGAHVRAHRLQLAQWATQLDDATVRELALHIGFTKKQLGLFGVGEEGPRRREDDFTFTLSHERPPKSCAQIFSGCRIAFEKLFTRWHTSTTRSDPHDPYADLLLQDSIPFLPAFFALHLDKLHLQAYERVLSDRLGFSLELLQLQVGRNEDED